MPRSKEQDPKQLLRFRKSSVPKVGDMLEKSMKLVHNQIQRLEHEMFTDENWDTKTDRGKLSSQITTHLLRLGTLAKGLGEMYMKVQKTAKENADMMTFDEKIEACADFLLGLGKLQRRYALQKLYPAITEIEHGMPPSRKPSLIANAEHTAQNTPGSTKAPSDPPDPAG
jgi:hypothetical protein